MSTLNYIPAYDEVRGLLGVSDEELGDDVISLKVYRFSLEEALKDIDVDLISDYETTCAVALGTRTDAQRRFVETVQAYSTYHLAAELAGSLALAAPKTITDGKAMVQRQAGTPHTDVKLEILRGKARALSRLADAYAVFGGASGATSSSPFLGMNISSPSTDPVTG